MELVHYNYDNFQRISNIKSTMNYIYMAFEVSFILKLKNKKKKKKTFQLFKNKTDRLMKIRH